jgi:hypothetical protein
MVGDGVSWIVLQSWESGTVGCLTKWMVGAGESGIVLKSRESGISGRAVFVLGGMR